MQYDGVNMIKSSFKDKLFVKKRVLKDYISDSNKRTLILLAAISFVVVLTFIFIGLTKKNFDFNFPRRVKKIAAMILTGGSIAFSSVVFQTITNNRILTPSVLGLDSLYMFIQTLVVYLFGSSSYMVMNKNINFLINLALMIGFSAVLYRLMFKREGQNIYFLLLIGMIFGSFFGSLSSFMQMLIDPNEFLIVQDKMFASFSNVNTGILALSAFAITVIFLIAYRDIKFLDVISLGRNNAINLGIDYNRLVKKYLLLTAVLISVSTALVGPITFLGILVVNLAKEVMKTYKHLYWFAAAIFISIISLVGGQLMVERVFDFGTNLSVVINFIGGSYFIYLILKESSR